MKFFGKCFFLTAAIMTIVVPCACLCDEPAFGDTSTKNSQQIIFDIDGVNAVMHNACPDEDPVDCYDQDTGESYEDETDADEDGALSYDILNGDDEEDDESDLDDNHQSSFSESISNYKAELATEKKVPVADTTEHVYEPEEIEVDIAEPELEQDVRTNMDSNAQGVETEQGHASENIQTEHAQEAPRIHKKINGRQQNNILFMSDDIDQSCPAQENSTSGSIPGAYCNYPYDLMDYIQYAVIKVKMFFFDCFV